MGEKEKKSIKDSMYEEYGVTEEEIDRIVLEQRIENEEEKIKVLKELIKYKTFKDYVNDHEKEFDMVDITDDYKMIIISENVYPDINLDLLKKMGVVADHFGLLIFVAKDVCEASEKLKKIDN